MRAGRPCSRRSTGSSTTASGRKNCSISSTTLENYKPIAKRRWGYFALPILRQDRLVGKLDATAGHKALVLRVSTTKIETLKVAVIEAGGPALPGGGTPKQPVVNAEVTVNGANASLSSRTGKVGVAIFHLPTGPLPGFLVDVRQRRDAEGDHHSRELNLANLLVPRT